MSELRTMSAGEPDRFGARFDEIRIPTLCEAVALLKELSDCIAFVELKRESVAHLGVETVLAAALPELQPITERSVVVSFNAEVVENLRDHTDLKTAWVVAQWNDSAESMARRLRPDYLFCNYRKLPATNTPLWSGPWCWVLYEVRESATALRLKRMGADLIESMAVGELIGSPPFTPETPIAAP